jgi:hypothetical protein
MSAQNFQLYIDDTGNRDLDHKSVPATSPGSPRWFALGGVIIADADYLAILAAHADFCARYNITIPLHSQEIRRRRGIYGQIARDAAAWEKFMRDLAEFLVGLPVIGIACVIDRLGYHNRYAKPYSSGMWRMPKTAYSIVAERSAKWARRHGATLEIFFERSGEKEDRRIEQYHKALKANGMPFAGGGAGGYAPLTAAQFSETVLGDANGVMKSAPLAQIADLYLYPMVRGRYEPEYRAYQWLCEKKKLLDHHLSADEVAALGIKYSCFDGK